MHALILTLPAAASIFLVCIIHFMFLAPKESEPKKCFLKSILSLHPDKGLAEQGLLWLSILTPLCYFIVLGYFAWQGSTLELSAHGYSNFIKLSVFPIGILSISLPLSALIARIHSTQQTAEQIRITKKKNDIDAFYAHRKAMFEYFSSIDQHKYDGGLTGGFQAHPRLHIKFFKSDKPEKGLPEINKDQFKRSLDKLHEARSSIEYLMNSNFVSANDEKLVFAYLVACKNIYDLAGSLVLPEIYEKLSKSSKTIRDSKTNLKFISLGIDIEGMLDSYRYTRSFLRTVCEFSGYSVDYFDNPETRKKYRRIDKENYPLLSQAQSRGFINEIIEKIQNLLNQDSSIAERYFI